MDSCELINDRKQYNLGGSSLEKRVILYISKPWQCLYLRSHSNNDNDVDVSENDDNQWFPNFTLLYSFFFFLLRYIFRFDLLHEDWGVDTSELKEPVITQKIIGSTEDWEKVLCKKNAAVKKAMFTN